MIGFAQALPAFGLGQDERFAGGSRITLDTTAWRPYVTDEVLMIARHEIAHAMLAHLTPADATAASRTWVVEGFARYLELRGKPA